MLRFLTLALGMAGMVAATSFQRKELKLIHEADDIMRVLTVEKKEDLKVLRVQSQDLSVSALKSQDYHRLVELMLATVQHPSQDGVGIAAPQVGINRRVVAVKRYDKENEPFEVYPNIRIVWASAPTEYEIEGCLSVPDLSGIVMRSAEIVIEYADVTRLDEEDFMVRDTVRDFTARIFQHEIDHLDGILYIDKVEN